jgi:Undecaprenyl-phosphate glucose phosphotransferase
MLKRYHHIVGNAFRGMDMVVIGGSWLAAYSLRFHFPIISVTRGLPEFSTYASLTPLVMLLWAAVFTSTRVYSSKRLLRRTDEAYALLRAHFMSLVFFIALTYLISEYKYSRGVMLYFGALGAISLVTFRIVLRTSLRSLRKKGFNLRHIIAVGEGAAIESVIQKIERFPELGLRVLGIVTHENSPLQSIQGKKVLGHIHDLPQIIKATRADRVLISLPRHQYSDLDRVLSFLKDETIDLQLIPDIHEYVTLGCEIEEFDGLPIVNLNDSPLSGWAVYLKRITDIILSAMALIALAPLLTLIALAVKLTSKGPIFYSQERMGMDGKTFPIYKFRSMRTDAESTTGAVWAKEGDHRRTPIGAFLRSTSLDELPQLWNILVGDMSIVGPRPERPIFVEKFRHEIPGYMLRHKVKAGLTGWAQVNGWRGNTSLTRRIECDLYYIRNWSYGLDWKIMVLTLWKGLINKNAY